MNLSLLIPGLCSVLLLTAFAYMYATTLAPIILLITSSILLVMSYSIHRNQFQSDYRNSTWQESLRPVAPFVLIGVVILIAVVYNSMLSNTTGVFTSSGGRRR